MQLSANIISSLLAVDCYPWLLFRTSRITSFNLRHVVPWPRIKALLYVSISATQFLHRDDKLFGSVRLQKKNPSFEKKFISVHLLVE